MNDILVETPILYTLGGILAGGFIAWLWRGAELAKLRGDQAADQERLQDLQMEQAGLLSERDMLATELTQARQGLQRLQSDRNEIADKYAGLRARQEADAQKHLEQVQLLDSSKRQLKMEFENLAHKIFEERGKALGANHQQSLESLLKPFGEQILQFQSRVNEVHAQSIKGNESLASELRNLLGIGLKMSDQAENLASALKGDKKTTGSWGEMQLERTLQMAGLERGSHYEAQSSFRDDGGRLRLPDFVIKLPDGKHLIIDSKVSLVDYDRAVAAETDDAREAALRAHTQALKKHIDDLSAKDYAALHKIDSPELVFMFMPIEAAYIEAMKFNRELFNEGYAKNVVLVSHTTLLPMLRTVASLWVAYRSNQEAREISTMAGDIYNKVCLVGQRLEDMGKTLNTVTDKYNRTVTALVGKQGLYSKIERFKSSTVNAQGQLPNVQQQHEGVEHGRLGLLQSTEREDEEPGAS